MAHIAVRQQKSGVRSYRVKWRDPDGVYRERTFRAKGDAVAFKIDVEKELKDRGYHDDRKGKLTLAEVAEEYLATRQRCKPRTIAEHRRVLNSRILPNLGKRQIASISVSDCSRVVHALSAARLRPTTIEKAYGLLRSILSFAVRRRYIHDNPATEVALPDNNSAGVAEFEARYLTPEEFARLIEAAEFFHPVYGLIVRLLGTTGMRIGELAGLNMEDIHILGTRGKLDIRRTWDPRYGESTPKSSRSNRTVTLLPSVVPDLSTYLAAHPRLGEPDAPLFIGRVSGGQYMNDWLQPATLVRSKHARCEPIPEARPFDPRKRFDALAFSRRIWARAIKMANVDPLRIHDMRHTAASLMLSSGMPLAMVSRQLGHASVSTTDMIYGGLLREEFDHAVLEFGEWLAERTEGLRERSEIERATVPSRR